MNGLPGLDLDHLKTFVEVAKEGNFSRAAAKVFRSQPAVSAQIRQLEDDYQQRLFDRSGKAVRLTPAGEILLQYAQSLLRLHALRAVWAAFSTPLPPPWRSSSAGP